MRVDQGIAIPHPSFLTSTETKPLSHRKVKNVMPSLSRSCQPCIAAKRRCNRATPDCARCAEQGLDCRYTNSPGGGVPEKKKACFGKARVNGRRDEAFQPEVIRTYDSETLQRLRAILLAFADEFRVGKGTAFIHCDLHHGASLKPLEEARRLMCDPANTKTRQQAITRLIRQGNHQTSYTHLLTHVQAATILSIPYLLTPCTPPPIDTNALWALTHRLWEEAPPSLEGLHPREAWLVAESVRRTILVCNVLLRTWMVLRQGYAVQSLCIEALPFEARTSMWERNEEREEERLVSVAEFVRMKGDQKGASNFEELILLAFRNTADHITQQT